MLRNEDTTLEENTLERIASGNERMIMTIRKFLRDENGDLPQVILLVGLLVLPLAIFLLQAGNIMPDMNEERVDQLLDNGNNLQVIGN